MTISPSEEPTPIDVKRQAKLDAAFDDLAYDVSRAFTTLINRYPGGEPHIALAICDSLGLLVAISAKDPVKTMGALCERLQNTPFEKHKTAFFGFKLGVPEEGAGVVQIGPPKP